MYAVQDEIKVRINAECTMKIRHVPVLVNHQHDKKEDATSSHEEYSRFLTTAAWSTVQLLQSQLQKKHATTFTNKNTSVDLLLPSIAELSHLLLKHQVSRCLETLSVMLVRGNPNVSSSWKIVPGGDTPPIVDTQKGIYLGYRWKNNLYRPAYSELVLSIGKYLKKNIAIDGDRIVIEAGSIAQWGKIVPASIIVHSVLRFESQVLEMVRVQLAEVLYRQCRAMGVKRVTIDMDHLTVRILTAGEWDGTVCGSRKVSGKKDRRGCMYVIIFFIF